METSDYTAWWKRKVHEILFEWLFLINVLFVASVVSTVFAYTPLFPAVSVPSGFHRNDSADWFQGCECNKQLKQLSSSSPKLVYLPHTGYYGYDLSYYQTETTFENCKFLCMNDSKCEAFAYRLDGTGACYPKAFLGNGFRSTGVLNHMYIKVSNNDFSVSNSTSASQPLNCSALTTTMTETGQYKKQKRSSVVKYTLGFAISFGVAELVCIILGWLYMFIEYRVSRYDLLGYSVIPGGFKKFSFAELKKATDKFRVKLGERGFGTVYKGVLPAGEVIAAKQLEGVSQGHDQFWAEMTQ